MARAVADALAAGEPVLLPTDTVYGLCCDAANEAAVTRLSALKGRDPTQPIALLATSVDRLLAAVPELPDTIAVLLPGPFTLLLPNPANRFPWLGGAALGVRVPVVGYELDRPVAATSANLHGGPDPRRLDDVPPAIRDACGAELDAGELPGTPSTVIDLTGPEPRVLREGAGDAAAALELLR